MTPDLFSRITEDLVELNRSQSAAADLHCLQPISPALHMRRPQCGFAAVFRNTSALMCRGCEREQN